jgi:hypothetical protein
MTKLSTIRKLTILSRVVGQSARRNRTISAVFQGVRTTANHFGRVLHQLWLEVTGFVFLALAFIGAVAFFRELARYQAGQTTTSRLAIAIIFTLTFIWFGATSFWRVWKKS